MAFDSAIEPRTQRKFYLDYPGDGPAGGALTFVLSLHGGGSNGKWQRGYFPVSALVDRYRLVVATPTAATAEPIRRWVAEADDTYLEGIVDAVFDRFGAQNIAAFWLVGHSQGGMTSNRLLGTQFFRDRVDGWLSLSGGRFGHAPVVEGFGPPGGVRSRPSDGRPFPPPTLLPDTDLSFIFATGEHEIVSLPETSPWAEMYGAGPRRHLADVVDDKPGQVYDTLREGRLSKSWGFDARPGTARIFIYPDARDGRVIADVVRFDKGHTEGLEPNITEEIVKLIRMAPGGKAAALRRESV